MREVTCPTCNKVWIPSEAEHCEAYYNKEGTMCHDCNKNDEAARLILKEGYCPDHKVALVELPNEYEGGVTRHCPMCHDEAAGELPF